MPATMLDIARDLNVSVVTVSKVLRNQGRISEATRERVLRRARELNYQTNWVARSLVTQRTFSIGLLLPEFGHPFFAEIARAVALALRPQGYHVVISSFEEDPELEITEADALLSRRVDGFIIASSQPPRRIGLFQRIQKSKVPYVLIDRPFRGLRASFVGVDNRAVGRIATEHLLARGCCRIAHLHGPDVGIASDRFEGYRQGLEACGLRPYPRYIADGGFRESSGYFGMRELLKVNPRPDGVFCYNDPVAIGAMKAILEARLNIPNDVAIVGAGNVPHSDLLAIPLTTVDQGTRRIGTLAAELLLERIASKRSLKPVKILIPPRLVERESTQRRFSEGDCGNGGLPGGGISG